MKIQLFAGSITVLCLALAGCNTPPAASTSGTASAPAATSTVPATSTPAAASKITVPTLVVQVRCKDCEVKPEVPKVIRESYEQAATKAGASIASDSQATLTITGYSTRGVSRLLGPLSMALTDEITGTVTSGGREFAVAENARLPLRGIESVAKEVGQSAFAGLSKPQ
jgi:hypothetical protein